MICLIYHSMMTVRLRRNLYGRHAKNLMKTDIKEMDNGYELIIDLPGFKKDEIKVSLDNGYLSIAAAKWS